MPASRNIFPPGFYRILAKLLHRIVCLFGASAIVLIDRVVFIRTQRFIFVIPIGIIGDLVVIKHEHPCIFCHRGLKRWVLTIRLIDLPEMLKRCGFVAIFHRSHRICQREIMAVNLAVTWRILRVLVGKVPHVEDEIHIIVFRQMMEGIEIAAAVVITGHNRESKRRNILIILRQGSAPSMSAHHTFALHIFVSEAIAVGCIGSQPVIEVHYGCIIAFLTEVRFDFFGILQD